MKRVLASSLLILTAVLRMAPCLAASPSYLPPPPLVVELSPRTIDPQDSNVYILQLWRNRDTRWLMYETDNAVLAIGYGRFMKNLDADIGRDSLKSFLIQHFKGKTLLRTNRDLTGVMMSDFVSVMQNMLYDGDVHVFDKRRHVYVERIKRRVTPEENYMFMDNVVFHRTSYGPPSGSSSARKCAARGEQCGGIAGISCCDGLECKVDDPRIMDAFGVCVKRPLETKDDPPDPTFSRNPHR